MNFFYSIEHLLSSCVLIAARLRGLRLKLRGARVDRKVSIGQACRFLKPWCIKLGFRVKIEDSVYIKIVSDDAKCSIGDYVFIGKGVELNIQQEIQIGAHALLAPGVFVVDHNHQIDPSLRINQQNCEAEKVVIEEDAWIGANAVILPGVRIGSGAIVGAGAVVNKDVDAMTIVAGVPAKVTGRR